MHPTYPTLVEMVASVSAEARRHARVPVDPAELDRYTHHVLGEIYRTRPRITDYLPELTLKQVLALVELRRRLRNAPKTTDPAAGTALEAMPGRPLSGVANEQTEPHRSACREGLANGTCAEACETMGDCPIGCACTFAKIEGQQVCTFLGGACDPATTCGGGADCEPGFQCQFMPFCLEYPIQCVATCAY